MKPYDEKNAQAIMDFWAGKINDYAICGFLSNWNVESNMRSNNMENAYEGKDPYYWNDQKYTDAVDSGTYNAFVTDKIGYGLAQWTSKGRKDGLINHVHSKGVSISDMQAQLEWAEIELNSSGFKETKDRLENCTSAGDAAVIIMTTYEKPASMNDPAKQKERADMAEEFYRLYYSDGSKKTNRVLALSAGHYLYTPGKRCLKSIDPNETREWVLNSRIADYLTDILSKYDGVEVLRLDDPTGQTPITIEERAKISDAHNADFYLAIHHNAGINGGSGGGVTVYHYPLDRNKIQATELYHSLVSHNGLKGNRSNPIKETDYFYEVYAPAADSILVENGFMDSTTDTPIILTEQFAVNSAQGLAEFFVNYWDLQLKSDDGISDLFAEIESIRNNITALEVELDKKLKELQKVVG